jgi:hypothetical protein
MPRVGPGKNIRAMDLLLSLAVLAVIASPSSAVLDNCKLALPLPNTESGNTSLEPRR